MNADVKQVLVELLVWTARVLSTPVPVNDSIHIGSVMMADPLIYLHGQRQNVPGYVCNPGSPRERDAASER